MVQDCMKETSIRTGFPISDNSIRFGSRSNFSISPPSYNYEDDTSESVRQTDVIINFKQQIIHLEVSCTFLCSVMLSYQIIIKINQQNELKKIFILQGEVHMN